MYLNDPGPRYRPYFTGALMAVVVAVYGLQMYDRSLVAKWAVSSDAVRAGEWYLIITGALLHGGPLHLFMNVYFGWQIGRHIESHVGPLCMVVISAAAMLGSGISIVMRGSNAVGLSGVLYGWLASWFAFHLTYRFPGLHLSGPQRNAYLRLLGLNLLISLLPGISLLAHVGGFVGGFIAAFLLGLAGPKPARY